MMLRIRMSINYFVLMCGKAQPDATCGSSGYIYISGFSGHICYFRLSVAIEISCQLF